MDILIVAPPASFPSGNRGTAAQWASLLGELGHQVRTTENYRGEEAELLIALHADKCHAALVAFKRAHPDRRTIVALTGTDLYPTLSPDSLASLQLADRIVALHPRARDSVPSEVRDRLHIIVQSAAPPPGNERKPQPQPGTFDVCVVGHLREVKDPMRAAAASRLLPAESQILIRHVGKILETRFYPLVAREQAENRRYQYLGELTPHETQAVIASSRLLVLASRSEGGARVLGEAMVAGIPVLASRNEATESLLHDDYPGLFQFGQTRELAALMARAEADPAFLESLEKRVRALSSQFDPARERESWRRLLSGLPQMDSPGESERPSNARMPPRSTT